MLSPGSQRQAIMLLTILGFLCGMALSARFSVLILVPGIPLAWLVVAAGGLVIEASAGSIAAGMGLAALALQAGYMAGIGCQWALQAIRLFTWRAWPEKSAVTSDRAAWR